MLGLKKIRIYLDTSVISYLKQEDTPEKMQETLEFWEMLKERYDVEIVLSNLVLREINQCSSKKLEFILEKLNELKYVLVDPSEDEWALTKIYLDNSVLTSRSRDDLMHIAIATLNDCRYIVSWNFKHFVNPKTINAVALINKLNNLPEVAIVSPSMMLGGF